MKLVTRIQHGEAPNIWHFLRKSLPPQFKVEMWEGYGTHFYVGVGQATIAHIDKPWIWERLIGYTDTVELLHPEYFSDFDDAIRKYETSGGKVKFVNWQSK